MYIFNNINIIDVFGVDFLCIAKEKFSYNRQLFDIFIIMDYSKFYLRNRSIDESDDPSGEEFSPQIVYIDYPKVRDRQVDFDYEVSPEEVALDVETAQKTDKKARKNGRGLLNKISIFVLTIIIVVLSTFVISDFVVDGQLMTAWGQMVDSKNVEKTYYLVGLDSYDDYDTAKVSALEFRKGGASGNIVKDNEKYLVLGNIFAERAQAEKVAGNYQNGCVKEVNILRLKVKDKDLNSILESNGSYYAEIIEALIALQYDYEQNYGDLSVVKSEIAKLKTNIAVQKAYFESKTAEFEGQKVVDDISLDMGICLALLSNIETTGQQKANVLSDIRYYAVQIALNSKDLRQKYS